MPRYFFHLHCPERDVIVFELLRRVSGYEGKAN